MIWLFIVPFSEYVRTHTDLLNLLVLLRLETVVLFHIKNELLSAELLQIRSPLVTLNHLQESPPQIANPLA